MRYCRKAGAGIQPCSCTCACFYATYSATNCGVAGGVDDRRSASDQRQLGKARRVVNTENLRIRLVGLILGGEYWFCVHAKDLLDLCRAVDNYLRCALEPGRLTYILESELPFALA